MVVVVYCGVRGYLDKLQTSEISKFEAQFLAHVKNNHSALIGRIHETGDLNDADDKELATIITSFLPESGLAMKQ